MQSTTFRALRHAKVPRRFGSTSSSSEAAQKKAQEAFGAASAAAMRAGEYARSALGPFGARLSGLLGCPCPFSPHPFLRTRQTDAPHFLFYVTCIQRTNNRSSTTSPWRAKCSSMSTPPSVSGRRRRSARCSGRTGRYGRAHARSAIGVRSCGAESMLVLACTLSKRMGFLKCVSFSLRLFFLCVSSNVV